MINNVVLVGRLAKEPVLRKTANGTSVVSFTVASSRNVGAGQKPQADFINCVAWNRNADNVTQYVRKGHLIGVEGRLQTRSYKDKDGKSIFITEVVCESIQFLEKKEKNDYSSYTTSDETFGQTTDMLMDDVPF